MFQTFDDNAPPAYGKDRLAKLRAELKTRGLAGFIVPRADEHQGEYVPARAERLRWLTGFSGSAGLAIVLQDKAAVFVDGRYTLQVRQQVDLDCFEPVALMDTPPARWIEQNLAKGAKLGYDPWLHTVDAVERFRKAAEKAGAQLIACADNPLDAIWSDQPAPPLSPIVPHDLVYAGEPAEQKLVRIAEAIEMADADAAVFTMPDSIAWLFNLRGQDVQHTPLPLCFALIYDNGNAELFIDDRKLTEPARAHLSAPPLDNCITILPPNQFGETLDKLGAWGREVQIDPATAADWINSRLAAAGARVKRGADPCELPKACKNDTEIAGAKAAHLRDGLALCRFLAWLAHEGPKGAVDEIQAARTLEQFRADSGELKDLSFDTISGAGEHGAIVHYRVTNATNRTLQPGDLYLVDSGAQYLDGTTDVTRTVAIGNATPEQRDRFTRVLKGHITLASARFPAGTSGAQLDALARLALWQAGLDYDHGTGHGVGAYLSVHEGPQRISKTGHQALLPGMIVSNEPGYYKSGGYGIRIENLEIVMPATPIDGGERPMMGFEALTLAPIDINLVEPSLLSDAERAWLNAYHARIRDALSGQLDEPTRAWLDQATQPV